MILVFSSVSSGRKICGLRCGVTERSITRLVVDVVNTLNVQAGLPSPMLGDPVCFFLSGYEVPQSSVIQAADWEKLRFDQ